MINKDLLLKRLSIIKMLYKIGVGQSTQSEMISHFSILSFHDSVEMFLKLAAEHKAVAADKFAFLEYWEKIPELTLKESMRNLNARRVNLKHKGLLPAKLEIETSRVNTTDFFDQNCKVIFNIDFAAVSLFELVLFPKTKALLNSAQEALNNNGIEKSVTDATISFYTLLDEYKKNKKGSSYKTNFEFIERISVQTFSWEDQKMKDKRLDDAVKVINKNFENLEDALAVLSIGLDYRKYVKFKILTPVVHKLAGGDYHLEIYGERNWSVENCQFLIDFALDSALILQEFDYDYKKLDISFAKSLILREEYAEKMKKNKNRPTAN